MPTAACSLSSSTKRRGSNGENFWAGQAFLRATPAGGAARVLHFTTNLPSAATANRRVLVATPGFAALGIVTPDYTMPANFLPIGAGQVNYAGVGFDQLRGAADRRRQRVVKVRRRGAERGDQFRRRVGQRRARRGHSDRVRGRVLPSRARSLFHYGSRAGDQRSSTPACRRSRAGHAPRCEFNVYAAPGPGTSPVCRIRIPPEYGDSHFYGRGTTECNETRREVSYVRRTRIRSSSTWSCRSQACARQARFNVYRVFTAIPAGDANHRYTIERSVRDLMESQQHWQVEGDGDDLVVMCVPPTASAAPAPAPVAPAPAPPAPPPMPDPMDPPYYPGYP